MLQICDEKHSKHKIILMYLYYLAFFSSPITNDALMFMPYLQLTVNPLSTSVVPLMSKIVWYYTE